MTEAAEQGMRDMGFEGPMTEPEHSQQASQRPKGRARAICRLKGKAGPRGRVKAPKAAGAE